MNSEETVFTRKTPDCPFSLAFPQLYLEQLLNTVHPPEWELNIGSQTFFLFFFADVKRTSACWVVFIIFIFQTAIATNIVYNNKVVWSKTYGALNLSAAVPKIPSSSTIFPVASVSKVFTVS